MKIIFGQFFGQFTIDESTSFRVLEALVSLQMFLGRFDTDEVLISSVKL